MRFHIVPLLMMLLPVAGADLARAGDKDGAAEQNENESRSGEKNPAPETDSGKRNRTPVRTLEEFVPSEEISADKPVSFPADI